MVGTVLLAFSFVFAIFAAIKREPFGNITSGWTAFAFFVAAQLFGALRTFF